MTNHYDHRRNKASRSSYRGPRKSRRPASETEKGKFLLPLAAAGAGIFLLAAVSAVTISHLKGNRLRAAMKPRFLKQMPRLPRLR